MLERLLACLDGSSADEGVLAYVDDIAARSENGALVAVAIVCPTRRATAGPLYGFSLNQVVAQVRTRLAPLRMGPSISMANVISGKPAREVALYAGSVGATLIVMAVHSRSTSFTRVAARVFRTTRTPQLLITGTGSLLNRKPLINRLLVPLDLSGISATAISNIETFAKAFNAEVLLLHVLQPSAIPSAFAEASPFAGNEFDDSREAAAAAFLYDVKGNLNTKGVTVAISVVKGDASEQIVRFAKTKDVDLIIMPSRCRTIVGRSFFGSVTERVLRTGGTPVLIVPRDA